MNNFVYFLNLLVILKYNPFNSNFGDFNMINPVYKFFFDELEENEIPRYSNGTIIEMKPSTPELSKGFERIVKELESRGYRRMKGQTNSSCCFSKPEYCNAAFIGTSVNPFSFRDKIWCWSNQFAISKKYISISSLIALRISLSFSIFSTGTPTSIIKIPCS